MKLKVYHNPRCSKSRMALAFLDEKGVSYEVIEYLKEIPSKAELTAVLKKLGIHPTELLRKGEADFKEHFRGKELTEEQWVEAMIQYPKLIERPIIINGNKAVIGRPTENILDIL